MNTPDFDYLQRLKRIEGYAEIRRDNNTLVELKAGLYATLFFEHVDPSVDRNEGVREALIECWDDYWQVVGTEHQIWTYRFFRGVKGFRLPTAKVPPFATYLRDPENFGDYQYYVHGGTHEDDASEYLFSLAAFPIYDPNPYDLGYLRLQAPLGYVTNGRLGEFVDLIKRCAQRLNVDQGHGGLGFLRTYNEENTTKYAEAQLSKVFTGVDIDVPYVQISDAYDEFRGGHVGIDSPHWLNFLNDGWVQKLGGVEGIRAQLPSDRFVVEAYRGGLFIQAGAYPEPGHIADGLPQAYVWLNRVLKPIRSPTMAYCYGDTPGQLATDQGAYEYFTRFDVEKPPETPQTPTSIFAVTGDLCPRSGLWSPRADVPIPDMHLQQGKPMPAAEWRDKDGALQQRAIPWQWVGTTG
ncbi:hypothetical protein BH11PSE9_BH11PSE9_22230 [soil metagenome]